MLLQAFHRPFVSENYGYDAAGRFGRHRYYNLTASMSTTACRRGFTPAWRSRRSSPPSTAKRRYPTLIVQD